MVVWLSHLALMREGAEQRRHDLHELFIGLRYGTACRAMPNDMTLQSTVDQQSRRWMKAVCFDVPAFDLQGVLVARPPLW